MKKILAVSFCATFMLGFAASASAIHIEAPAETSAVVAKGGLVTLDGNIRHRGDARADTAENGSTSYNTRVRLGTTIKTGDQVTGRAVLETGSATGWTYNWGEKDLANLNKGGEKVAHSVNDGTSGLSFLEAWIQYQPGNWGIKVGHMPLALGNKLFFDHTPHGDDAILVFHNPSSATHIAALAIKFSEGSPGSGGDDIDGYVALFTHKLSDALKIGANWTYLHQGSGASGMGLSNLGITADGKVGNISWMADIEYQFGDVSSTLDAAGMAAMVGGNIKLDGFTVGANLFYGSGDDDTDNDVDQFINFLGNTRYQHTTLVGYIFDDPAVSFPSSKNTGIANKIIYQLNAKTKTACPVTGKDLSLKGRLNYLVGNEDGNMLDSDIGIEVELFGTWKLAQGLIYGVEAAYLFAGDAYGPDPENPWFVRHRMELTW